MKKAARWCSLAAFVLVNGVARIPQKRSTGADGLKRHGDSAIAHLLADYASKNPSAAIEFIAIPSKDEMELEMNNEGYDWDRDVGCI